MVVFLVAMPFIIASAWIKNTCLSLQQHTRKPVRERRELEMRRGVRERSERGVRERSDGE